MSDSASTLNIPQLLVIAVVSFLIFRWYNSSAAASGPARAPASRNATPRVNPVAVEQVAQMFPQLSRRDIIWDLSRNGSNVAATTERVLSGRGLEPPPPSFQPPMPPTPARIAASAAAASKPAHPDLITRYNLSSKIGDSAAPKAAPADVEAPKKATWSQNKNERQQILQRRREEMILAARRKMQEKDKAKTTSAS